MALNVSSVRTVQAGWSLLAPRRSTSTGMIPGYGGRTQCLSTKLALCITPSFWLAVFFWVLESRHGTRVLYHYCHREEFVREIKEKLCYIGLDYYTNTNRLRKFTRRRPTLSQTVISSLSRRTFQLRESVVRRTQCPFTTAALCITPSFVRLAVVSQ